MEVLPRILITEERIKNTIAQIADLQAQVRDFQPKPSSLEFSNIIGAAHAELAQHIDARLAQIKATSGNRETEIRAISTLGSSVQELYYFLHSAFVGYRTCLSSARSLYYLCDWYSSEFGQRPSYIISTGANVASVISLREVLYYLGFDRFLPPAWATLQNLKFYFVQISPDLASAEASFRWPIVLHEFAHIVDEQLQIVERHYPYFSYPELSKILEPGAFPPPLVAYAKEKIQAIEYAADVITSTALGPAYAWCFMRNFFEPRELIDPPPRHPQMHKRILTLAAFLEVSGFPQDTEDLRHGLRALVADIGPFHGRTEAEAQAILEQLFAAVEQDVTAIKQIIAEARNANRNPLTGNRLNELLEQMLPAGVPGEQRLNQAVNRLVRGASRVLDPSLLFYLAMRVDVKELPKVLEAGGAKVPERESDRTIQELVADRVRLYAVKQEATARLQVQREKAGRDQGS